MFGSWIAAFTAPALCAVLVTACEGPPTHLEGQASATFGDAVSEQEAMRGFSWVESELLAGMPRPGVRRSLEEDVDFLRGQGLVRLISLTEEPLPQETLQRVGMQTLHLPVQDFTAPTQEQMHIFVNTVHEHLKNDEAVGVHCTAGLGRSGTMLAAYFVSTGMTAPEALEEIRRQRPGSVETASQEAAIEEFWRSQAPASKRKHDLP